MLFSPLDPFSKSRSAANSRDTQGIEAFVFLAVREVSWFGVWGFSLVQSTASDGAAKCFRKLAAEWFGALGVAQIRAQAQKGEKIRSSAAVAAAVPSLAHGDRGRPEGSGMLGMLRRFLEEAPEGAKCAAAGAGM